MKSKIAKGDINPRSLFRKSLFYSFLYYFQVMYQTLALGLWPSSIMRFFIDFGLEKNKKNIWKLQNQKWPLDSRWQPKFDLLLKSTNRLFYQIF
jgi:hypothetical protein